MNRTAENAQIYTIKHRLRYRLDNKALLGILTLGLLGLIVALGLFMFVQLSTRSLPLHFKANERAQIIDPVPLDQESISKPALLDWVNDIMMEAFSFNYSNQHKQQAKLTPYFSADAMKTYLDLITNDDDFKLVQSNYYVVSVSATSTPEILASKAANGRYAWQIQLPAKITFANAKASRIQEVMLEFFVWRVTAEEAALGIIIGSFDHQVTNRYQPKTFR